MLLLQLELPLDVVEAAAKVATAAGTKVVLNPAPAHGDGIERFAGLVDVLVPNEIEAAALSGIAGDPLGRGHVTARAARRARWSSPSASREPGSSTAARPSASPPTPSTPSTPSAPATPSAAPWAPASPPARPSATPTIYANAAAALAVTQPGAEPSMPTAAEIEALLAVTALRLW